MGLPRLCSGGIRKRLKDPVSVVGAVHSFGVPLHKHGERLLLHFHRLDHAVITAYNDGEALADFIDRLMVSCPDQHLRFTEDYMELTIIVDGDLVFTLS